MFEIFRVKENKPIPIEKIEKDCWINITQLNEEDLAKLEKIVKLPDEIIDWLKDVDELPKFRSYPKFLFILVRTPYNHPRSDKFWITHPLGIIFHDNFVITICFDKNDVMDKIKNNNFDYSKSAFTKLTFMLYILKSSSLMFQRYLKDIHKMIIECEGKIATSHKNAVIFDFLDLEKSLVYFDTGLRENRFLYEEMLNDKRLTKHKDNRRKIELILSENEESTQIVEVYSNILSSTLDAFASIISNNLNITMKTLTSLTLLIAIPTLIASIYGMNVEIPFSHMKYSFAVIMGSSLLLSFVAIYLFWKNKFF